MNVLYFGCTKSTSSAHYYYTAFSRLGASVLSYAPDYFEANSVIERAQIKLSKAPPPAKIQKVSKDLIEICKNNHFDIVFVMAENFLDHTTLETIRRDTKRPPLFVYHSHDNNFSAGICKPATFETNLSSYDLVFTTKSQNVPRYQHLGQEHSYYIPSAYEPTVHRPLSPDESKLGRNIDVSFIGTYDNSRDSYLETVGWNLLEVWGDRWAKYKHFRLHSDKIHAHPIYYYQFADILTNSACSLGLLREEAQDLHTQRTFEIPACKTLQLAPRNDEILSFFKDEKEIVCFESEGELTEKVGYYLKNESKRLQIAEKGYQKVVSGKHSYQDRVTTILKQIESYQSAHSISIKGQVA